MTMNIVDGQSLGGDFDKEIDLAFFHLVISSSGNSVVNTARTVIEFDRKQVHYGCLIKACSL